MFILKIKREVLEYQPDTPATVFDKTEVFIEADTVTANSWLTGEQIKKVVEDYGAQLDNFESYTFGEKGTEGHRHGARLLTVKRNGEDRWYLATHAWLMSSTGDTIERLA